MVGFDEQLPHEVLSDFLTGFSVLYVAWYPDGQRLSIWGNHLKQGWSFWTVPLTGGAPVKSEFSAEVVKQLKAADVTLRNFQWAATDDALYFEGVTQSVRNI